MVQYASDSGEPMAKTNFPKNNSNQRQKRQRAQQILMAVVALIIIFSMVLASIRF